jgi:hypothetical protein
MGSKKEKKSQEQQTKEYVQFLEKALKSKNLKNNDPLKYEEYKKKLEKEKLKARLLK